MQELEAAFGAPVLEAYGMTEAAHQMASNPLPPAARKPGSVGPGTDVRISIMDAAGRHLPPRRARRGRHQGPERDSRLRKQSRGEREVVHRRLVPHRRPGLSSTPTAICTLVARLKELINRGGEKISPREIDEVLLAHPAVAEAVCFGVPHPTWGEEVAAAVVVREPVTEAELLAYCRERLADFKRPKQIHITEAIPRTATGKIQRGVVAKAYAQTRREDRRSPAPARSAAISARGSRRPAPTSCCSRAVRTCGRCRNAACACVSADGDFEVQAEVTGDLRRSAAPTSSFSA